jgi:3,4-dihydroxy 2-butanone 4-phosphate synthase/GTP cyclohydrolase II
VVTDILAAVARGEPVIIVDDLHRENEGDLIVAADAATPELMGFLIRHTSGIICVAMEGGRLDELQLGMMVAENTDVRGTAFTVSVDAKSGTTTGISGWDRCRTVRTLIHPDTLPGDLSRPGHVYPLRYRPGGVLVRPGHTEAAVDLARLSGRYPAGVLAEVMNDDGTVARLPELEVFARTHGLLVGSIDDLIEYRGRAA